MTIVITFFERSDFETKEGRQAGREVVGDPGVSMELRFSFAADVGEELA
jgi:hypothetical protein